MMGARACLHAASATWKPGKERKQFSSPETAAQNRMPGSVNTVNLENSLGEVEPDRDH
jgi:hypothetical protein